jgi:hypothetical protein
MPQAAPTGPPARTQADEDELLPYVLSAEIGKGSFATVYRAYHEVRSQSTNVPQHVSCPSLSPSGNP